jgi:hypothetical protein
VAAADVWIGREQSRVADDDLVPALGVWGHHTNCAATITSTTGYGPCVDDAI